MKALPRGLPGHGVPATLGAMTPAPTTDASILYGFLAAARDHVWSTVDGLAEADLNRSVLPSGWSPAQALHHLAVDDERFWVRAVMVGEDSARSQLTDHGWVIPDGMDAGNALALYRTESALSDAALEGLDLDAAPAWWPEFMGQQFFHTNREVLLHLIVETTGHAGQLDAVRELLDGTQWCVVTG